MHQPVAWRPAGSGQKRPGNPYYQTTQWRRIRAIVLQRCGYRCELALPGCSGIANTADHIRARDEGGSDDPANLRGACPACHNRRHPDRWLGRKEPVMPSLTPLRPVLAKKTDANSSTGKKSPASPPASKPAPAKTKSGGKKSGKKSG